MMQQLISQPEAQTSTIHQQNMHSRCLCKHPCNRNCRFY